VDCVNVRDIDGEHEWRDAINTDDVDLVEAVKNKVKDLVRVRQDRLVDERLALIKNKRQVPRV
jgi:hypothetical protein